MKLEDIIKKLEEFSNTKSKDHMAKFGISPEHTYGVSIPHLRDIAKLSKRNHALALQLWEIDTRETRILAAMIAEPEKTDHLLVEKWTLSFDYWEICDQCVMNLFEKLPFAWETAVEYSSREEEFVKRTGFVIMARLAVSDKKAGENCFDPFFPLILKESTDERNMVKKAVNWALRQIGKRNIPLNHKAIALGQKIRALPDKCARWIAADALRELQSDAVQNRLAKKKS
ncbi:MAG: DNA alkylation repair protein [bacterium]|nr:DNA alkylation repair protein [bacterium]